MWWRKKRFYLDNAFVDRGDVPADLRSELGTVNQARTRKAEQRLKRHFQIIKTG